jgi:hypothetical protein
MKTTKLGKYKVNTQNGNKIRNKKKKKKKTTTTITTTLFLFFVCLIVSILSPNKKIIMLENKGIFISP